MKFLLLIVLAIVCFTFTEVNSNANLRKRRSSGKDAQDSNVAKAKCIKPEVGIILMLSKVS